MAELEHGDAQPLRPASEDHPVPDPLGRGNHTIKGFVEVPGDAELQTLRSTLASHANELDDARTVRKTGGTNPGLYVWDHASAEFWFLGSTTTNVLTVGGGGTGGGGWIRVTDVEPQSVGGQATNKVYDDPGQDTILESVTVSEETLAVSVEASFPNVRIDGNAAVLVKTATDVYSGTVNISVTGPGPLTVTTQVYTPDGAAGATDDVTVTIDAPPALLTLSFAAQGGGAGGAPTYPGSQTELKAGDTVRVEGTTDKNADAIIVSDVGAGTSETVVFAAGTSFSVDITIADRGTTLQALAATIAARDATSAAIGATRTTDQGGGTTDGVDLVNLNNLFPSVVIGSVTYPASQSALKGAESATVANTLSNYDTVLYDDPTSTELSIPSPTVAADPKSVSRAGGSYNISVNNFRVTATRTANDAVTVQQANVAIANVAAQLTVTEPAARLRSGGNDGTTAQDHEITITADQELFAAPTLAADAGGNRGAFVGGGFVGGPTVWTRDLRVDETVPDEKGTFAWGAIAGTNRAGIITSVITGDSNYTFGGFVPRTITYPAFAADVQIGVEIDDYSKFQADTFTSTGNPGVKQIEDYQVPPDSSVTDGYSGRSIGSPANTSTIHWADQPARGANSGGTAQLTNVEETV